MLSDFMIGAALAVSGMLALLIFGTEIIQLNVETRQYWHAQAALADISDARTSLGATLSRLEQQQSMLLQKVSVFSGVTTRLTSSDYAAEVASMSAAQIKLMSAPQLLQISRVNAMRVLDLINQPSLAR